MRQANIVTVTLLIILLVFPVAVVHAKADSLVVRAILFYSPTCAWCLTSAVVITALMLLSIKPGKLAFSANQFLPSPS